jgi:hypothetical protein
MKRHLTLCFLLSLQVTLSVDASLIYTSGPPDLSRGPGLDGSGDFLLSQNALLESVQIWTTTLLDGGSSGFLSALSYGIWLDNGGIRGAEVASGLGIITSDVPTGRTFSAFDEPGFEPGFEHVVNFNLQRPVFLHAGQDYSLDVAGEQEEAGRDTTRLSLSEVTGNLAFVLEGKEVPDFGVGIIGTALTLLGVIGGGRRFRIAH